MTLSTLAAPARLERIVKKSRFLAQAASIEQPDHATAFLERVRATDASHHCWAWRVGPAYRSSDDGEPAGTAGRPILAAIDGQGYDRVMVVVARWFGGTKLGAGGLVRAYGGTAAECLRAGERLTLIERVRASVVCGFEHVGAVHQLLARFEAIRHDEAYTDEGVRIGLDVPRPQLQPLQTALRDATRGQARLEEPSA